MERKVLLQAGRLNLCQCYLKLGRWIDARNVCDKVGAGLNRKLFSKINLKSEMYLQALEESDTVAKAWFRRGEAQLALNDCESARADFDKCLQLEPDNKVRARVSWNQASPVP